MPMQHKPWIIFTCFLLRNVNFVCSMPIPKCIWITLTEVELGPLHAYSNERIVVFADEPWTLCTAISFVRLVRNAIWLCSVRPHSCWNIIKIYSFICVQYHINVVSLFHPLYSFFCFFFLLFLFLLFIYSRFGVGGESISHAHTRMHNWHSCRRAAYYFRSCLSSFRRFRLSEFR